MNATDVMDSVVARLVDAIEAGAADWQMPWRSLGSTGWPTNAATGNRYSGGNVLPLTIITHRRGWQSSRWATYKQWEAVGAQVRKGERSTRGVYWHTPTPDTMTETDDTTGDTVTLTADSRPRWARAFAVFNAAQVDGYDPPPTPELDPLTRDARTEAFFAAIPAEIR